MDRVEGGGMPVRVRVQKCLQTFVLLYINKCVYGSNCSGNQVANIYSVNPKSLEKHSNNGCKNKKTERKKKERKDKVK